ncbi:MAG: alpha-mannosidase, partial [Clostridiales bacterium]|nr:alpha-mannosidase [Clostridiales bacterium]
MTLFDKAETLRGKAGESYWASRIASQIGYALKLSAASGGRHDGAIERAIRPLAGSLEENGAITAAAARQAERALSVLSPAAKELKIICAAHAHIDMNWQWGYQETAALTIETFRTVLDLMREYPAMTFSQSQASVYEIVEKHDREMLGEIRALVREGRWEVTASTWVEADKNMPNGESMARHILYAKSYLSRLLGISPDALQLDFEPDTFGHSMLVPEILSKGGVKYYYHCRGHDKEWLYKWQAPSGASVLACREPMWYGGPASYDMLLDAPQWCARYGVDAMLKVYGVGDHGGGPTRRDIEIIADMMEWPVMPTIKFGTFHEFFGLIERHAAKLPVVTGELNFIQTGCYTSQGRIKMANRIAEDRLYAAEAVCAAASALSQKSYAESFRKAWENTLFSQFHDILPGSCINETREYAMGRFQDTLAAANINIASAMRGIAAQIDTSAVELEFDRLATSEGAGAGLWMSQASGCWVLPGSPGYRFPQTERGNGKARIYHIFNPTAFDREGPAEIAVWDWPYDLGRISVERIGEARIGGERPHGERIGEARIGGERISEARIGGERPHGERIGEVRIGGESPHGERIGEARIGGERISEAR